jgi:hypothetical protein
VVLVEVVLEVVPLPLRLEQQTKDLQEEYGVLDKEMVVVVVVRVLLVHLVLLVMVEVEFHRL